jgi:hypothetical protein
MPRSTATSRWCSLVRATPRCVRSPRSVRRRWESSGSTPTGVQHTGDDHQRFPRRMGLATAVRYCWRATAQTVSGFRPVPEENVLLIGIRDTYETERRRLESSGVTVTGASLIRVKGICELWNPPPAGSARSQGLRAPRLGRAEPRTGCPSQRVRPIRRPGGAVGGSGLGMLQKRLALTAARIASYDPAHDGSGILCAAIQLTKVLAG